MCLAPTIGHRFRQLARKCSIATQHAALRSLFLCLHSLWTWYVRKWFPLWSFSMSSFLNHTVRNNLKKAIKGSLYRSFGLVSKLNVLRVRNIYFELQLSFLSEIPFWWSCRCLDQSSPPSCKNQEHYHITWDIFFPNLKMVSSDTHYSIYWSECTADQWNLLWSHHFARNAKRCRFSSLRAYFCL